MKATTQLNVLLNHMARGKPITRLNALFEYHIQNITARVRELRASGIDVQYHMKKDANGHKYAQYYITAGEREECLKHGKIFKNTHTAKYEVV